MRRTLLLFFCAPSFFLKAQMPGFSSSACQPKLSAYTKNQWNNLGFHENPASGGYSSGKGLSILSRNNYIIPELGYCMILGNFPSGKFQWAAAIEHAGWSIMSQDRVSLFSARALGDVLNVGAAMALGRVQFKGYAPFWSMQAGLAMLLNIGKSLSGGIYFKNLIDATFVSIKQGKIPICSMGIGYDLSQKFNMGLTMESTSNHQFVMQAAWSYHHQKKWGCTAGFSSVKTCFLGGIIHFPSFQMNVNCHFHPLLGGSPELSAIF